MYEFKELEDTILEIENNLLSKDKLTKSNFKEYFKLYFKLLMLEAGDVAIINESLLNNSIDYSENEKVLVFTKNIILRIHDISDEILEDLCYYSGFSEQQVNNLIVNCRSMEKRFVRNK